MLLIALLVLQLVPSLNLGETLGGVLNFFYARPGYKTHYFSFSKLMIQYFLSISGFAFVNIVPLLNNQPKFFWSKSGNMRDFVKLLLVWTPLIFFFTSLITIRSYTDLDLYCSEGATEENMGFFKSIFGSLIPSTQYTECKYSFWSVYVFNVITTAGFQVGLNLSSLDTWIS